MTLTSALNWHWRDSINLLRVCLVAIGIVSTLTARYGLANQADECGNPPQQNSVDPDEVRKLLARINGDELSTSEMSQSSATATAVADQSPAPTSSQAPSGEEPEPSPESLKPMSLSNLFPTTASSRMRREWDRYKIRTDKIRLQGTQSSGKFSFFGGLGYTYDVRPAFIQNLHQRQDIYAVRVAPSFSPVANFALSAGLGAVFTFSRVYETKTEAIRSKIKSIHRMPFEDIPWTADKAIQRMAPGDAVRMELYTEVGGGVSRGFSRITNGSGGAGASATRSARLIIDVYRLKGDAVRLRMISNRVNLQPSVSVGLSLIRRFAFGIEWLSDLVGLSLRLNFMGFTYSPNLGQTFPIDTIMTDYVFRLSPLSEHSAGDRPNQMAAITAYNNIMNRLKDYSWESWKSHLNFNSSQESVREQMRVYLKEADDLWRAERSLPVRSRSLDRLFQGSAVTHQVSATLEPANLRFIETLFQRKGVYSSGQTSLRSIRADDSAEDLIVTDTDMLREGSGISVGIIDPIGTYSNAERFTVNGLFEATRRSGEKGRLEYSPNRLSDLIITREIRNSTLSPREIREFRTLLSAEAPHVSRLVDWSNFDNGITKTNGLLRLQVVFQEAALEALRGFSQVEIYQRLVQFINNHPRKDFLSVSAQKNFSSEGTNSEDRFAQDLLEISQSLDLVFNHPSRDLGLNEFQRLQMNPLFNDIGTGFIAGLLPSDRILDLIFVRLTGNGVEDTKIVCDPKSRKTKTRDASLTFEIGTNDVSALYAAMTAIRSAINDRSFDLRIMTDEDGIIRSARNVPGFVPSQRCPTCDAIR